MLSGNAFLGVNDNLQEVFSKVAIFTRILTYWNIYKPPAHMNKMKSALFSLSKKKTKSLWSLIRIITIALCARG